MYGYGGFPGMGMGMGMGNGYGFGGGFGAWGIGAIVVGTLILIAICCVFAAGF